MHLIKHRKLVGSKLSVLLLITLIWLIADNLLEFVFPTYLEGLGKSYFEIGLLLSLASISGLLIDLPMGALSDKASRKKLMISGLVLSVVFSIFIFSFNGNFFLALAFLFWGFAYQIWKVPRDAQFAALTDKIQRGEECGIDNEVKWIGQTIGPLIGGFVFLYFGFSGIIGFYSLSLVFAIIILFLFIKETNHSPLGRDVCLSMTLSSLISELRATKALGRVGILLLCFSLLFTAWEQILFTLIPLFYGPNALNISPKLGGMLLAFFSLPGIFVSYHAGKMADKVGKKNILFFGLVVMGASLVLFSLSHNLYLIFFFALIASVGWASSLPALNGLIIDLSYNQRKGKIVGIWAFFMDAGYVIGPIVGGLIADMAGLRNTFLITGLFFVLASVFLVFTDVRLNRKK